MRELSIIFSGPMVKAIIEGRKTTTRRVVTKEVFWVKDKTAFIGKTVGMHCALCPYGVPGDRLWVRENAWIAPPNFGDEHNDPFSNCTDGEGRKRVVGYSASMDYDSVRCAKDFGVKQSPSIHMPRWASRLTLEITDVRVERLKDIGEDDAWREGIGGPGDLGPLDIDGRVLFHELWDSINAKRGYGWDVNPWVWALTFRKLDTVTASDRKG